MPDRVLWEAKTWAGEDTSPAFHREQPDASNVNIKSKSTRIPTSQPTCSRKQEGWSHFPSTYVSKDMPWLGQQLQPGVDRERGLWCKRGCLKNQQALMLGREKWEKSVTDYRFPDIRLFKETTHSNTQRNFSFDSIIFWIFYYFPLFFIEVPPPQGLGLSLLFLTTFLFSFFSLFLCPCQIFSLLYLSFPVFFYLTFLFFMFSFLSNFLLLLNKMPYTLLLPPHVSFINFSNFTFFICQVPPSLPLLVYLLRAVLISG